MTPEPKDSEHSYPVAMVRDGSMNALRILKEHWKLFGWVVILCGIVALILVVSGIRRSGTAIRIEFERGEGLKPGDALRFRGIVIGEVGEVALNQGGTGISVVIRLLPRANYMACEGSVFWIERPLVALARMRGLETVAGSKFVGVIPGPQGSKRQTQFVGLPRPPVFTETAQGLSVNIHFTSGPGLQPGDSVKYRGMTVGEVVSVELDDDLEGVTVRVWLLEKARLLARAGTQFWVERPRMNLGDLYGFETIVGGRHIAALPGPAGAIPVTSFEGLDLPPQIIERESGGLEVVLSSPNRRGLEPGAPVMFRGVTIGRLLSVALASDAVRVNARAYITPEYAMLIREKTRFWNASGIDFSLGWKGAKVDMYSLKTIIAGGVSIAVPSDPGKPVLPGYRFDVEERPDPSWRTWSSPMTLGSVYLPNGAALPNPLRAVPWTRRGRKGTRDQGWVLLLQGNRLLGPAQLFSAAGQRRGAMLALAGRTVAIAPENIVLSGAAAIATIAEDLSEDRAPWPLSRLREPREPEDCLLVSDALGPQRSLSAERMTDAQGTWEIDPAVAFPAHASGAIAVSRRSGEVVGVLVVTEKGVGQIVKLRPAELELAKPAPSPAPEQTDE